METEELVCTFLANCIHVKMALLIIAIVKHALQLQTLILVEIHGSKRKHYLVVVTEINGVRKNHKTMRLSSLYDNYPNTTVPAHENQFTNNYCSNKIKENCCRINILTRGDDISKE